MTLRSAGISVQKRVKSDLPELFWSFLRNRELIMQMARRDVVGKYRGSFAGLAWSFFNPVLMLAVYTFVFSVVFQARWNERIEHKFDFALILFAGLIAHGIFAECVVRAPTLILSNVNYVKKVVFPLETLVWAVLGSTLFHSAVSVAVLLLAQLLLSGSMPWTAVLLPVVLLPLSMMTLGVSWFLASAGVYFRDISQITVMFTTVMMFLSPIFYPLSAVPEGIRRWLELNPMAVFIEEVRNVLIFGNVPDFPRLFLLYAVAVFLGWAGFAWFQCTRRGFADVL